MQYRREIDGLRAVAVVPVILFHADIPGFSGGFIGVDVFFVISGYLITTLIASQHQCGQFTLAGFYERRARRILPALFLVMIACVPFAGLVMLPADLRDFSASVLAVCGFLSNILFWRESDYFGSGTNLKPLVHTWSLAVEEQFYLLYPLLLLVVLRLARRYRIGLLAGVAAASLAAAQWGSRYHPQAAFYLLPTRGWELLLGALAALYATDRRPARSAGMQAKIGGEAGGILGVLLIVSAVVVFDESTPFPGTFALVPTLGATLIILYAAPDTLVGRVLGSRLLVGIGLVSYSAYLWHQPLFAFARLYCADEPGRATFLALTLASILLAWASWRLVEEPFRDPTRINRATLIRSVGIAGVALFGVAIAGYGSRGFAFRYPPADRYLVDLDPYAARAYVPARFLELQLRPFDESGRKRVVVIGDSYAEDLVNAIFEGGLTARMQVSTYLIPAACGNLDVSEDLLDRIRPVDRGICAESGWYGSERLREIMRQADAIWIASSWLTWQVELLPQSMQRIDASFGPKALVFGEKDFGTVSVKRLIRVPAADRAQLRNPMSEQHLAVNRMMKSLLPADRFIDVSSLLCGEGATCPLFTDDGRLITYDGGHLTREGARFYGERLAAVPLLREFLGN
jgi:peptidoglycan/LPS O-acetylase OafA/YrhL